MEDVQKLIDRLTRRAETFRGCVRIEGPATLANNAQLLDDAAAALASLAGERERTRRIEEAARDYKLAVGDFIRNAMIEDYELNLCEAMDDKAHQLSSALAASTTATTERNP